MAPSLTVQTGPQGTLFHSTGRTGRQTVSLYKLDQKARYTLQTGPEGTLSHFTDVTRMHIISLYRLDQKTYSLTLQS
jgi:hypothetical protein